MKTLTYILTISFYAYGLIYAQDSSFILSTKSFDNYTPGFIGNGYFSLATTVMGLDGAESYMDGLFDHAKNDIPRIAALPYWNKIEINFTDEKNSLLLYNKKNISNYFQQIDMYNGMLTTSYNYTISGRKINIKEETFISRNHKNIAVIKINLRTDFDCEIDIAFPLQQREPPHRKPYALLKTIAPNPPHAWPQEWYPGFVKVLSSHADMANPFISIIGQPEGKKNKIAEAAIIDWPKNISDFKQAASSNSKGSDYKISFKAKKGEEYTFYKYIYISKINSTQDITNLQDKFTKIISKGYNELFKENNNSWKNLWNTDIIVEGNPKFQKVIHSMLFYLLCSSRKDMGFSIPPMGLSSAGYYGHVFWDSDTWMFPALLVTHPDIAKAMVMFRYKALNAAKANANKNGYKGAMYPWESDELGEESIPFFAYQNALYEIHITGDVAFAQWQYFMATQDTDWLKNYGWPVIKNGANFWKSRVKFNKEKDEYDIDSVVSVDEGLIGINNDTYTNSLAKKTLKMATKVAQIIHQKPDEKWEEIADKIVIPYDSINKYHPTFEDAPKKYLGSVVALLNYPLNMEPNRQTQINDLNNAVIMQKREGQGVMMTTTFLPIMAAELDEIPTFNYLVKASYTENLRSPFNALTETPNNNNYNFLTGAGGFLQQVIFGYSGLRITEKGLESKFTPHLPEGIKKITLKNLKFRGKTFNFVITEGKLLKE